jgi:L-ascorbate metabolism protein UlaG (beta-lactamase superfamily)
MDIVWYGSSAVSISDGSVLTVVDPDLATGKIASPEKIDFAVSTRNEHGIQSKDKKVFDWPGEYEVKGASFLGIQTNGKGSTLSYRFVIGDIVVSILTGLLDYPSDDFIERLGDVHVLLVNVGQDDKNLLPIKDIHKLVEAVQPSVVIPIGWKDGSGEFSDFLKEMDVPMPEVCKKFVCKKTDLKFENMELVVLESR